MKYARRDNSDLNSKINQGDECANELKERCLNTELEIII